MRNDIHRGEDPDILLGILKDNLISEIGKQMQFFGARCNLAKLMLIALNGGYDTTSKMRVGPQMEPLISQKLDYEQVLERFDIYIQWLSRLYVNTMIVIHYMSFP